MKRARAQQPKLQEGQDGAGAAGNTNPKPQRRAKQPRQPKAAAKKAAAARESSAAWAGAAVASVASSSCSSGADMAPTVPDVCGGGGHEAWAATTVEWDLDGGLSNESSWWTFGVEEEKLLGWFPFVEEDFRCPGGRGEAEMAFDDDIWRIHQIYEIPNYAAK